MRITSLLRGVASTAPVDRVVAALERLHRGNDRTLAVLTYHRVDGVDARPDLHPGLLSATPDGLAAQMDALAARWHPVELSDVVAARRGAALPRRAVLVTFDDAYEDTASVAWPILRARGIPATLFVATGFPDEGARSFWWDDLHEAIRTATPRTVHTPAGTFDLGADDGRARAFRAMRSWVKATGHGEAMAEVASLLDSLGHPSRPAAVLTWDELRRLSGEGLALAPHSITHAMLDRLPPDELAGEIDGSRRRLRAETGSDWPVFAYPSGQHDERVVAAVRDAGIEVAFTTRRGINRLRKTDWLRIRRVNVSHTMPPAAVRAQLLPGLADLAARAG